MIRKIDIQQFGLFNNYEWNLSVSKDVWFKKLNIIYGRNYSGKTTLSRIFRCIEKSKLHPNYCDSFFRLHLADGRVLTQDNLLDLTAEMKIRVYNSDFISENLSWMHKSDGTIEPFTVLGEPNVEIDHKIGEINKNLGSVTEKAGLFYECFIKEEKLIKEQKQIDERQKQLDDSLRKKAQEIKNNGSIYNVPTYNILSIGNDIASSSNIQILTDDEVEVRKKLLREERKNELREVNASVPKFATYIEQVKDLLEKEIRPSEVISELEKDKLLQEWVRVGIEQHRGKRSSCGFCGNPLTDSLWRRLEAHFVKESDELRDQIESLLEKLQEAKRVIKEYLKFEKVGFYGNLHQKVDAIETKWLVVSNQYLDGINFLIEELIKRRSDIFTRQEFTAVQNNADDVYQVLVEYNQLVKANNSQSKSLIQDQESARKELRLSEIKRFANEIFYFKRSAELKNQSRDVEILNKEVAKIKKEIHNLSEEQRVLQASSKDESIGAELVNTYLCHFFGHDHLKLVAVNENERVKFKVTRDNIDAQNLSEGECSLISFCYFIARLEDELRNEKHVNNLVIYIDDPISSLDSNHVFFVFSLIETVLAKPNRYGQLFISTHSMDFLKYIKRITIPKEKAFADSKLKDSINHFLIQRRSHNSTVIVQAPNYLKNYVTEFNYLFSQIHECTIASEKSVIESYHYSFGNNMRKFLEAYLFFKYPSQSMNLDSRLTKFFDGDSLSKNLVNRVVQEYSHLEEQFDRSTIPLDVDEIRKIAKAVVRRIRQIDPDQYLALCESVGIKDSLSPMHV